MDFLHEEALKIAQKSSTIGSQKKRLNERESETEIFMYTDLFIFFPFTIKMQTEW